MEALKLHVGYKLHAELPEICGLVNSGILILTLDGHPIGKEWIMNNLQGSDDADRIQVQSFSGYKLKVVEIAGGNWTLEVTEVPTE